MGVKASYGVGLKSAQAWGCPPMLQKCIFKGIRSALTPSLPLLRTLPFPINCFGNQQTDANVLNQQERFSSLRTTFPLQWGWVTDYGVDYEINELQSTPQRGPYTLLIFEYSLYPTHKKIFSLVKRRKAAKLLKIMTFADCSTDSL